MNRKLTIAALAVAAMAGCTNDDSSSSDSLEASFSSAITRVSGVEWEDGDQIGVMVTSDNQLLGTYRYNNLYNVTFTDPTEGIFTADSNEDKIYFSMDEEEYIHFYAYYPYSTDLVEAEESYTIDITDQSVPKKIDFMEASTRDGDFVGYNKSNNGAVALNFSRNMAKITLELTAGDGVTLSDITRVRALGYYSEGIYSFASNAFTPDEGNVVGFNFYKESETRYSAIMIPAQYEDGVNQRIYFDTPYGDVPLDMSAYDLERGVNKLYNVKVSQTEATCEGNEIYDWQEDTTIDGTENDSFNID